MECFEFINIIKDSYTRKVIIKWKRIEIIKLIKNSRIREVDFSILNQDARWFNNGIAVINEGFTKLDSSDKFLKRRSR